MADHQKPGPTGQFPGGKLCAEDRGELSIAVIADPAEGIVGIEFGTRVPWVGLDPATARSLAAYLIECAKVVEAARN